MTREWLENVLMNNPALKMSVQGGNPGHAISLERTARDGKQGKNETPLRRKYRNNKIYLYQDGSTSINEVNHEIPIVMTFDSEKEFTRWNELKLLERAGRITNLQRQTTLLLQEACERHDERIRAICYKADFTYSTVTGKHIVEDVKGQDSSTGKYICTKDFRLKWKMLKCRYPEYEFRIY